MRTSEHPDAEDAKVTQRTQKRNTKINTKRDKEFLIFLGIKF